MFVCDRHKSSVGSTRECACGRRDKSSGGRTQHCHWTAGLAAALWARERETLAGRKCAPSPLSPWATRARYHALALSTVRPTNNRGREREKKMMFLKGRVSLILMN